MVGHYNWVTWHTCKTRNVVGTNGWIMIASVLNLNSTILLLHKEDHLEMWKVRLKFTRHSHDFDNSHHGQKKTWTSRQRTGRIVPVSSWSSQEPNSNPPPGQRYQHWLDHKRPLWSQPKLKTTWNCSISPRAIGWAVPSLPPRTTCCCFCHSINHSFHHTQVPSQFPF